MAERIQRLKKGGRAGLKTIRTGGIKLIFVDEIREDWEDICIYCKQDGEPCNNCLQASKFEVVDDD